MPISKHLHVGLAAISKAAGNDLITAALCRGLLIGYEKRWGLPTWAVESVEQLQMSELGEGFTLGGKLDLAFNFRRDDGKRILCDHKTTGSHIDDMGAHYWEHLTIDTQISHYMLMGRMQGRPFSQVLWDVVKRPDIRPRRIAQAELDSITTNGTYYGIKVPEETARVAAAVKHEDAALLEVRMAMECVKWRPDYYFARGDVFRSEAEIDEYLDELRIYLSFMGCLQQRRDAFGVLPPRNPGACRMFNRTCDFMGLCSGTDTMDSRNWRRKQRTHPELEQLDPKADTFRLVSNSSMGVFRACPRKHHYQYVERIEPATAKPDKILFFGTVWHSGLEAYLESLRREQEAQAAA
jgi:hypothetical protein